jgi:dihydrofolate reductase
MPGLLLYDTGMQAKVTAGTDESRWGKLKRIRRAGTYVMGRVTYQEMAGYWPASAADYAAPKSAPALLEHFLEQAGPVQRSRSGRCTGHVT